MHRPGLIAPLLVLLFTATAAAQAPPSPESVLGYPVGADYRLTTYEQALGYFDRLAAGSGGRLQVLEMGSTGMERPHRYLVISSAENLARLDHWREIARRLGLARGLSPAEAARLAAEGRAIAWIDVGLHATECAPSEHAIQLAYDLVTGEDARTRRIRENVITLIVFPNPDGMTAVADWYNQHVGTEFARSRMPWLYNRYVGHDNNRDSYNVTQVEVRNISLLQNREWFPNVAYNHHQTAPFPTRIWLPPYGEPTNPNKPGEVIRWENLIGAAMGMAFDAEGKPGAISRTGFDAWYPGFMTQVVTHHNIPSILTETALYDLATPHEYTLREIPESWRDFTKSAFYTTPWEGGWWRIGDAVAYCLTASKAVLDVCARYREEMLFSKYRLARANLERYEAKAPYGWAFPAAQADPFALSELLDKFALLGVEVYTTHGETRMGERTLPAGTVVVPTAQPFGGFVKTLLERQDYPDLRTQTQLWQGIPSRVEVTGGPLRPYDVAGWTLPLQLGLAAIELDRPASGLELDLLTAPLPVRPPVAEGRGDLLLESSDGASWRAVNRLLAAGVNVRRERGGAGRFVVAARDRARLEPVAREVGARARPSSERVSSDPLPSPRIALYQPWQGSMDEGWLRWILEHYDFAYTGLRNDRVRAGGLKKDFDVIVIPSLGRSAIVDGNRPGSVPPEYAGGIGPEGLAALQAFAREGGTVLFHESSCDFALADFGLPLRNVSREATRAGYYSAGSILRFAWNPDNGLTRGMNPQGVAFVGSRPALFEVTGPGQGEVGTPEVVGRFPETGPLLLSGYLEGEEAVLGKAAVVAVPYGRGQLVLVGFNLHNRAQTVADFKLLFNALIGEGR
jgi:hypothetical protein